MQKNSVIIPNVRRQKTGNIMIPMPLGINKSGKMPILNTHIPKSFVAGTKSFLVSQARDTGHLFKESAKDLIGNRKGRNFSNKDCQVLYF